MSWYSKYLTVFEKPFESVPKEVISEVEYKLSQQQSPSPLASVVVIAYNEDKRLFSCLWSLSESECKYPIEIIGVNNNSKDESENIFKAVNLPYFNELKQSCGHARNCGLQNAKGKYYICIDGDTMYPPKYIETLIDELQKTEVVAVSSLWSYLPDKKHPWLSIKLYEFLRDTHLFLQSFKRPELSVRGLVFAYTIEFGRKVGYRVDIKRGEDGSMALGLKKYGKIKFIRKRKARAVTAYGTLDLDGSFFDGFMKRIIKNIVNIKTLFTKRSVYTDDADNLM
jgi:Glycosyltransferases, probably involved in cell wall biogenesis